MLTRSGDPPNIEPVRVINLEELLDYIPLRLAGPANRREQVLGVDLVLDLLVARDA